MCCLFGILDYRHSFSGKQKSRLLSILATACEERGIDATGIAYNSGGRLRIYKRAFPAHTLRFRIPDDCSAVMGHTRMTTQGSETLNYNNHPFYGRAGSSRFALAHNGVLRNDAALRRTLRLPKTEIQTDSYIAVQLLEYQKAFNLNSLQFMAEQLEGSFSFTVLDERDNLYVVKGDNPLCIYQYPRMGLIVYASTESILLRAIERFRLPKERPVKVDLVCGDILRIDANGGLSKESFDASKLYQSWWDSTHFPYCCWPYSTSCAYEGWDSVYIRDLKSVAGAFGYSPDDVDALLNEGFSPEELEEYLYGLEL